MQASIYRNVKDIPKRLNNTSELLHLRQPNMKPFSTQPTHFAKQAGIRRLNSITDPPLKFGLWLVINQYIDYRNMFDVWCTDHKMFFCLFFYDKKKCVDTKIIFTGSNKSHELGCNASRQWQVNRSWTKLLGSFTTQTRRSHHSDELAEVTSPLDEERDSVVFLPFVSPPVNDALWRRRHSRDGEPCIACYLIYLPEEWIFWIIISLADGSLIMLFPWPRHEESRTNRTCDRILYDVSVHNSLSRMLMIRKPFHQL